MKLNILLVLILIATISQGRRLKFLHHEEKEETPAMGGENGNDGQSGEDHGEEGHNGEENGNNGNEGDHGEESHGEDHGDGEESQGNNGEESQGKNGEEEQEGKGEEEQGEKGEEESNGGSGQPTGDQPVEQQTCQGVIFDAGSSGTRVFVYTWPCRLFNYANPEIEITQHAPSTKVNPGISAFGNDVAGLRGYLQPLIDWAGQHVKEDIRGRTPILLGATAGMRILDWYQQYEIMEEVRNIFRDSGYLFTNSYWARIISGKDEGAYLWLSVNYLKGVFVSSNIDENQRLVDSYTTIDLGGASTQLADDITESDYYYLSPDDQYETDYHTLDTSIYNISLYSHSWLYYGQDQARNLTTQFLQRLHHRSQSFENPCFLKGYKFELPEGQTVTGTGNPNDCRDLIDIFLHGFNSSCDQCAIQESYIPRITAQTKVYAGGAVEPATKLLGKQQFTWQDFDAYNDFCSEEFNQQNDSKYYPLQCFLGLYTQELLKSGYLIDAETVIETGDINNIEPSWTLAAMFDQIDDNSECDDSPQCNFRRHMKMWRKDSMHPRMKEHKNQQPFVRMMP